MDQQLLDYYHAMFPGQMVSNMGNAPQGTNSTAGGANAVTKLALAMMQANRMKQYQQKYPQQPAPQAPGTTPPVQGQTLAMPGGMPGVPDQ